MPTLIRLTGRHRAYASAETAGARIEERGLHRQPFGPPPRLRPKVKVELHRRSEWPIYTLTPRGSAPDRTVVYLHGGAWVNEITGQHWQLAAQIAAKVPAEVIVPIFPLVPFATGAEVMPVIVELVAENVSSGRDVCLVGDSAGGQMALSAALALRDEHRVVIARTVLISPVLDLSLTNPLIKSVDDPWLAPDALRVFADRWRGDLELTDPRVDPLAADLTGLGPLTVFTGTRDILNPDARLLVEKALAAGVETELHEQPGLIHVYPLTPTPEGKAARNLIVANLRR